MARKPLNTLRGIETFESRPSSTSRASRKPLNTLRGIETDLIPDIPRPVVELENPSTPSGVLKPIPTTTDNRLPLAGHLLENPSTPSGVLKPCGQNTHNRNNPNVHLENPSTPSGVLKPLDISSSFSANRIHLTRKPLNTLRGIETSGQTGTAWAPGPLRSSKTPQHPPGY